MFRTLCVLLGMGLVVNLSLDSGLWAAESGKKTHLPVYSYRAPGSAPANEPSASMNTRAGDADGTRTTLPAQGPTLVAPKRMETLLEPSNSLTSVGNLPSGSQQSAPKQMETRLQPSEPLESGDNALTNPRIGHLEIEVSHSGLTLDLFSNSPDGQRERLCDQKRVALGDKREFPTPVGTYYVTHIYDDKPWWIPPKDRAWAAGDSPSQKVYGGTMAPLLKKRPARQKKQAPQAYQEDLISYEVQLNDDGYRFHGTNAIKSIGHYASHGCVRMKPADAAEVADLIKKHVGTVDGPKGRTENGEFVVLKAPVRLNIVK